MLLRVWHAFSTALKIRRLGMVHGEALAWFHGEEGFRRAVEVIELVEPDTPHRMFALWTARFARRRLDELRANDPAGRERLGAHWRGRRGSLMERPRRIDELLPLR
jgi:hypothetical protein